MVESRSKLYPQEHSGSRCNCQFHKPVKNRWHCPCPKRLNRLRMGSSTGKRVIPSSSCKATSARSKLVCANRRAPATTESNNDEKDCTRSIRLGEVRRNGRCCLTARNTPPAEETRKTPPT